MSFFPSKFHETFGSFNAVGKKVKQIKGLGNSNGKQIVGTIGLAPHATQEMLTTTQQLHLSNLIKSKITIREEKKRVQSNVILADLNYRLVQAMNNIKKVCLRKTVYSETGNKCRDMFSLFYM